MLLNTILVKKKKKKKKKGNEKEKKIKEISLLRKLIITLQT